MDSRFFTILLFVAAAYAAFRVYLWNARRTKSPTTIGFIDLSGGEFSALLEEDKSALLPMFGSASVLGTTAPQCTVLFLYYRPVPEAEVQHI
jgi:hypothetical protein